MEIKWHNKLPTDWDKIAGSFENVTLFHNSDWLNHIADQSKKYSIKALSVLENGKLLSIIPYIEVRKAALIKIFASPLGGTGTNYMGPLFNIGTINIQELLLFIVKEIRKKGYKHIEINSQTINREIFESVGFQSHPSVTNVIALPETEEESWKKLRSSCRNNIKNALKSGCSLEFVNDGALPKQFHDRLTEVYKKQGLNIPFGPERPISLCSNVYKILPVRVLNGDKVVAAGIFPYDENCIYFWGGAAFPEDYKYHPNELMHWEVIRFAVNKNIKNYNMCGGASQFKSKFGGEDIPYISYSMSFLPFLARARTLYKKLHFLKIKLKGIFSKVIMAKRNQSKPEQSS